MRNTVDGLTETAQPAMLPELIHTRAATHALLAEARICRCGRVTYWLVNRQGETRCVRCVMDEDMKGTS